MGLPQEVLRGIGIIHANDPESDRPAEPIGTGFAVGEFDDTAGTNAPFMVTARHVVDGQAAVWGLLRSQDGNNAMAFKLANWIFPDDPNLDLAIHVLQRTTEQPDVPIQVWDGRLSADRLGIAPRYGERLYFAGLHHLNPTTWQNVVPLVRTANVASLGVPEQTWGDNNRWGPTNVFLIDGQPWAGYSGSPVLMETKVTGPASDLTPPLNDLWLANLAESGGPDPEQLGGTYNFHALFGILCAMEGGDPGFGGGAVPTGIGLVLPVSRLTELLAAPTARSFLATVL